MRYYSGLGESMPNEQLAVNAQMAMQGKGGNLSERQALFVEDILSSYQMLLNLDDWEKQYAGPRQAAPPGSAAEKSGPMISNPSPPAKADTHPKKDK
jgi:hypothetical protein